MKHKLVLPREGKTRKEDRELMHKEINTKLRVVMLVKGNDTETRDFVDRAEKIAAPFPGRRVIHVRLSSLLTDGEKKRWFKPDSEKNRPVIAAVLTNSVGERCYRVLRTPIGMSDFFIDNAFLRCESKP